MDHGHYNIDRQDPSDEELVFKRPRLSNETDVDVTASSAYDAPINLGSGNVTKGQDGDKAIPGSRATDASTSSFSDSPEPSFPWDTPRQSKHDNDRDIVDNVQQSRASSTTMVGSDSTITCESPPGEREQWLRETEKIRKLNSLELAPEIVAYLGLVRSGDPQLFLAWNLGIRYLGLDPKDPSTWTLPSLASDDIFWDLVDYRPPDDGTFNRVRGMDRLRWFFWRMLFFDMHEWFTSHGIVEQVELAMLAVLPTKDWASPVDEITRRCAQGRNLDELCRKFGHGCLFYLQGGLVKDTLDDLMLKTDNYHASIVCLENWGLGRKSADLKVEGLAKKVRKHLLYQRVGATGTDDEV